MQRNQRNRERRLWKQCITVLALVFGLGACETTTTSSSSTDAERLGSRQFTAEQLAKAARSAALRFNLELPSASDIDSILESSDPKTVYDQLCDSYTGEKLRPALLDLFYVVFGMGGDPGEPENDHPALLATYIIMNDFPYGDLLTADYIVDQNGAVTTGQGGNAPLNSLAGFMTIPSWLEMYEGNNFLFNYVREVANVAECYKYPDPDGVGAWSEEAIAQKYLPRDDINCHSCHQTMNVRRRVWYPYQGENYNAGRTLTNHEPGGFDFDEDGDNDPVVEPRNSEGFTFTDVIETPQDFGSQIIETDRFKRCTARRFLAFALGYPTGTAGQNGTVPFDFDASSATGDIALLDEWTGILSGTHGMKVRPFLNQFCKSNDFISRVNFIQ